MGLLSLFTAERRRQSSSDDPAQLRQTIFSALEELRGYSQLQRICPQEIGPVDDLIGEIASAAKALRSSGHSIPIIDLTGIDPQFMVCFECQPTTKEIAECYYRMEQQASLKRALLEKWVPRGYRSNGAETSSPAMDLKQRLKGETAPRSDATLADASFSEAANNEIVVTCRRSVFRITDFAGIDRQHREAVIDGIARVWERLVGEPGEHRVTIACRVSTKNRENVTAIYDPDEDRFYFSSLRVPRMLGEQAAEAATWLVAGAHEATHKAQFFRGESPAPSGMDANHDDSEHEVEAWRVAFDLLKRDYPEARGSMQLGSVTVKVPDSSTFCS